jgi:hypothetical protein
MSMAETQRGGRFFTLAGVALTLSGLLAGCTSHEGNSEASTSLYPSWKAAVHEAATHFIDPKIVSAVGIESESATHFAGNDITDGTLATMARASSMGRGAPGAWAITLREGRCGEASIVPQPSCDYRLVVVRTSDSAVLESSSIGANGDFVDLPAKVAINASQAFEAAKRLLPDWAALSAAPVQYAAERLYADKPGRPVWLVILGTPSTWSGPNRSLAAVVDATTGQLLDQRPQVYPIFLDSAPAPSGDVYDEYGNPVAPQNIDFTIDRNYGKLTLKLGVGVAPGTVNATITDAGARTFYLQAQSGAEQTLIIPDPNPGAYRVVARVIGGAVQDYSVSECASRVPTALHNLYFETLDCG